MSIISVLGNDALLLVMEQLDAPELTTAAAVCRTWRSVAHEPRLHAALRVLHHPRFLLNETLQLARRALRQMRAMPSVEAAALSAVRLNKFYRRHTHLRVRDMGKLRSITAFSVHHDYDSTAVLFERALVVLGRDGAFRQRHILPPPGPIEELPLVPKFARAKNGFVFVYFWGMDYFRQFIELQVGIWTVSDASEAPPFVLDELPRFD